MLGKWHLTKDSHLSDGAPKASWPLQRGFDRYYGILDAFTKLDLEVVDTDYARLDLLGGPRALAHYPMGWAMVSCTPFRLYKINTHRGGHSVPFILSLPDSLPDRSIGADGAPAGGVRTQYQHMTDVFPTLAELCGVTVPTRRHGVAAPEPAGASFAATITDPAAPSTHPEQYYENFGHRGYYRGGWSVVTCHRPRRPFSQDRWELHNLAEDPTETRDLAAEHPDRLEEMQQAWDRAAWANQVYPLDDGGAFTLDGTKVLVAGGLDADVALVPARLDRGEVGVFLVPADTEGLERSAVEVTTGRPEARFELAGVRVRADALLGGGASDGAEIVRHIELTLGLGRQIAAP